MQKSSKAGQNILKVQYLFGQIVYFYWEIKH